jgi:EAL domain-containing protein (putative c-di-GMP-specific phosphodiesterase class I)
LPFNRLELEIVESSFIDDFEVADQALVRLRSLGIRIALDDFGTGYSSLTYLRRLTLDKIKIDQSFVAGVDMVQSAAIVQAIVALGRALGFKITAEGVETLEQHRFLRACGCHYLQGFLFSKPVAAAIIGEKLADASSPPCKPKKRGPFQLVPVILRAMVDRLAKTVPASRSRPQIDLEIAYTRRT